MKTRNWLGQGEFICLGVLSLVGITGCTGENGAEPAEAGGELTAGGETRADATREVAATLALSKAQLSALSSAPGAVQTVQTFTIPLGQSHLGLQAFPGAVCVARSAAGTPLDRDVTVVADDEGLVPFSLAADQVQEDPVRLQLACRGSDEALLVYPIEVVVRADAPVPATLDDLRGGPIKGILRPALKGDPQALTPREIAAQGFPPRPALTDTDAYGRWLDIASKPATRVQARTVTLADRFNGNSSNWSGPVESAPSDTPYDYTDIFGQWAVPTVVKSADHSTISAVSSLWVGLGGWNGSKSLIQAGTNHDYTTLLGLTFISYGSWLEWYPRAMQSLSNLPVHPGDLFYSEVWLGDSDGTVDVNGTYAWFLVENGTTGIYIITNLAWRVSEPLPFTATKTAEWIMERYAIDDTVQPLADYGTATISNSQAHSESRGWHSCGYLEPDYLQMFNGSTLLSSSAAVDKVTTKFTYKHTL
jgi:hypothetical protein